VLNVGYNVATNGLLQIGYRSTNVFMYSFYANDLNTVGTHLDQNVWIHW
jgi:hypothetical protein